jgi:hypothetical protein
MDHVLDLEEYAPADLTRALVKARDLHEITWLYSSDGEQHAAVVPAEMVQLAKMLKTAAPVVLSIASAIAPVLKVMLAEMERLAYPEKTIMTGEKDHG